MWKPQLESLKKNHRVITYDIRGHGKSEVGDGQYTLELFVDDLIGLLDHLRIERTIVCGLSMGCLCKKEESCQIRNFKNLFQGFSNKADIWKN